MSGSTTTMLGLSYFNCRSGVACMIIPGRVFGVLFLVSRRCNFEFSIRRAQGCWIICCCDHMGIFDEIVLHPTLCDCQFTLCRGWINLMNRLYGGIIDGEDSLVDLLEECVLICLNEPSHYLQEFVAHCCYMLDGSEYWEEVMLGKHVKGSWYFLCPCCWDKNL